jgi:two-component system, LytTR family, sensor kinase
LWMLIPLLNANTQNYPGAFSRMAVITIGVMILVFLNLVWLMPAFFFKKKYIVYILLGVVLIGLLNVAASWINQNLLDDLFPTGEELERFRRRFSRRGGRWHTMRYVAQSMPFIISFFGSTLFELVNFANRKEKEAIQLRSENLDTEMKFLRSQINPHFLFNSINNIYTLTVLKSDAAPENLLKLSGMLRYMLYECNADKVSLKKEIEYIQNYIDLMLLKDSKGLNVETEIESDPPNLMIAPLLLIPFIENAFKHSKIEDIEKNWIKIKLKIEGSVLFFESLNSLPEGHLSKDKVGGIGLKNVKRRLEIIYPEKYDLEIDSNDETGFKVNLKIELE